MINNEGDRFRIHHQDRKFAYVVFEGYSQIIKRRKQEVISGSIKNPFKPVVYGIGYYGFHNISEVKQRDHRYKRIYYIWKDMIRRCYHDKNSVYYNRVTICDKWKSFKNFYYWCLSDESNYNDSFYIDKDLLGDGKEYSPEKCLFVPKYINNLFIDMNNFNGYRYQYGLYYVQIGKPRIHLGTYNNRYVSSMIYMIAKRYHILTISYTAFINGEIPLHYMERVISIFNKGKDYRETIKFNKYLNRYIQICDQRLSKASNSLERDIRNKVRRGFIDRSE